MNIIFSVPLSLLKNAFLVVFFSDNFSNSIRMRYAFHQGTTNPSIIMLKQALLWKYPVSQHALAPFLICDIKNSLQYADLVNILEEVF